MVGRAVLGVTAAVVALTDDDEGCGGWWLGVCHCPHPENPIPHTPQAGLTGRVKVARTGAGPSP